MLFPSHEPLQTFQFPFPPIFVAWEGNPGAHGEEGTLGKRVVGLQRGCGPFLAIVHLLWLPLCVLIWKTGQYSLLDLRSVDYRHVS